MPIGSALLKAVWGAAPVTPAKPPVKKKAPVKKRAPVKKATGPAKKGKRK